MSKKIWSVLCLLPLLLILAACSLTQSSPTPSLTVFKEAAQEAQLEVGATEDIDLQGFYGKKTDALSKKGWKLEYYEVTSLDAQVWFDASKEIFEEKKTADAQESMDQKELSEDEEFESYSLVSDGHYYFVARRGDKVLRIPEAPAQDQKEIETVVQKMGFNP